MPAESTYTPEQNERMREVMQQMVDRLGNQREVGRALGMSQPAVGAFIAGKYGLSSKSAERLAALAEMTMDQLLGRSGKSGKLPVVKDAWPNRVPVIEFAKRAGFSDATVERLKAAKPATKKDPTVREWTRILVHLDGINELLSTT